ncbi:Uncharacterized protein TCM_019227 [Theobroma cacao]|uniref:Uncharacterized protein n=1 Tax=Theobroma cacao TaxID=3641 RepID=A0A061EH50_THECC|nr:Uncharacterized protein TCM_019227 [Theobroma cacao]
MAKMLSQAYFILVWVNVLLSFASTSMPQTMHFDHDQPLYRFQQASSSQPMNMVSRNSSKPTRTSSPLAESQQLSSEVEKERKEEEKERKKEEKKKKKVEKKREKEKKKNCSSAITIKQSNIGV